MNRWLVAFLVFAAVGCETQDIRQQREEFERRSVKIADLERELGECRAQLTKQESGSVSSQPTSAVTAPSLTVWKTLQLGTDQPTDPAAELKRLGYHVSNGAKQLLAKTPFATEPMSVDLVEVTVAKLGFPEGATTAEIYERALSFGLTRVPAEVGYRLRKELTDEPVGTWRHIGMDPIAVSDGLPYVFDVDHDEDGRWLYALYARPALQWDPGHVWVFARSKPR